MKSVSIAAFLALSLVAAPSFAAGGGCGGHGGNGGGNPKNNGSATVVTQKPWFVWQEGKLVRNPERV